jgi:hypothetical protein
MKKTVGDMQSTKTGMPDKDLNPLTSSSAESMKRLQPQNKPLGSSESTIGNRSKTTKESAPVNQDLTLKTAS